MSEVGEWYRKPKKWLKTETLEFTDDYQSQFGRNYNIEKLLRTKIVLPKLVN